MARGRLLHKNISESRRLSDLKTDQARLLWTWILPFLDSEGRFYASPEMIKGKIVPRIKTFTEKNIPKFIEDMVHVGLVTLYEVDGEKILQYRNFDKFQKIIKDREAAPLPGPIIHNEDESNSGVDQDQVESESRAHVPNSNSNSNINLILKENGDPACATEGADQEPPLWICTFLRDEQSRKESVYANTRMEAESILRERFNISGGMHCYRAVI